MSVAQIVEANVGQGRSLLIGVFGSWVFDSFCFSRFVGNVYSVAARAQKIGGKRPISEARNSVPSEPRHAARTAGRALLTAGGNDAAAIVRKGRANPFWPPVGPDRGVMRRK